MSGNSTLSYGLYTLKGFGKTGYAYFAGGLMGIMLWLRISSMIASLPRRSRLLTFMGENTKYIMALHIFSWFLFNALLNLLYMYNSEQVLLSDFSPRWYHSFLYYCSTSNPRMILLYYAVGTGFPLVIAWLVQRLSGCLRSKFRT